ncbi:DNA-processing protein DprA [Sinosporangium album]|nr:DNA-processing protein DprA [Sinosporangium album]
MGAAGVPAGEAERGTEEEAALHDAAPRIARHSENSRDGRDGDGGDRDGPTGRESADIGDAGRGTTEKSRPGQGRRHSEEAVARAALMRVSESGDQVMGRLVETCGAIETVKQIRRRCLFRGFIEAETARAQGRGRCFDAEKTLDVWAARISAANPIRDLDTGEGGGGRFIVPGDPEWPTQLDDLAEGRPLGLWLHGSADLRFSCLRSVGMVGSRAATAYGTHIAADISAGLSDSGWGVISGGAYGIDAAAHRGALSGEAPTVAVLACGADFCYPSGHHELFAAVRHHGLVISECPPGVRPTRARFLVRNRLIAALSRGTLVVEAALRSGALNTAAHASTLQRHLGAVPGPITSANSAGCHKLIREGKAICITSAPEMIELVGTFGEDLAPEQRGPLLPRDALSPTTQSVLDAVPARSGAGPATIAIQAGVDIPTALSCLGHLAAGGYIQRVPQGWRLRPIKDPRCPSSVPPQQDEPGTADRDER